MANFVRNTAYRFSIAAIIGALVASGAIYFTNDRVVKGYRAELAKTTASSDAEIGALTATIEDLSQRLDADAVKRTADLALLKRGVEDVQTGLGLLEKSRGENRDKIDELLLNIKMVSDKIDLLSPVVEGQ